MGIIESSKTLSLQKEENTEINKTLRMYTFHRKKALHEMKIVSFDADGKFKELGTTISSHSVSNTI